MGYQDTLLAQQLDIMNTELTNQGSLTARAAMWQQAIDELNQSLASLTPANDMMDGSWVDRVGWDFLYNANEVELVMHDWHGTIVDSAPNQALGDLADLIATTHGIVTTKHDEMLLVEAEIEALRVALRQAEQEYPIWAGGTGVVDPATLVGQIAWAEERILQLQREGGVAMEALAARYNEVGAALLLAVGGRDFQIKGGAGATDAATGIAGAGGPAAIPGDGPALPGGGPALPGGLDPADGAELPGGADPAGPGATADSAPPAAADTAVPGAGGDQAPGAVAPQNFSATNLDGAADLDPAAQPSLSGLPVGAAPTLPPGSPSLPTMPSYPGGTAGPGWSMPTVPPVTPFLPPASTPGSGSGAGSGGGRAGLSPTALRGLGGGNLPGGVPVPGLSIGGNPGPTSLPQAAVPVSTTPVPGAGAPPPATPAPPGAPRVNPASGGAVPPMMPPMMGGAGAGGTGGRPGSGAARRPPGGRGPAARPTPGLPGLLTGKATTGDQYSVPARSRNTPADRDAPADRARTPDLPPAAVQPVDEDLWHVDGNTTGRRT
ncbi:hypothetical protein [Micromonospora sp. NBC_01813]|uniref:hypothetical protein n=1 Tax=Micromonospora sp. NBC_01813 TaxID=2975988 RepID=UPI002DDB9921|nr:hypothetical protein [Micromonospora sp. NBC_01813]WSA06277.1 hypothetical protein OG958_18290 [Micromonospora sp. NBC_01813]